MYKLYVIPGSHACRSAMMMLDYKRVSYQRVDVVTLTHAFVVRLHGFDSGGETRKAGAHRPFALRFGDLLGTVPALACGDERISTNHQIARFLDQRQPQPPLLPVDPERKRMVEEAERWANGPLQMTARRLPLTWSVRDPAAAAAASEDGRLGYLLYRQELARRLIMPVIGRVFFSTNPEAERSGLHDRAEPGADPVPAGRDDDVRGSPRARARRSVAPRGQRARHQTARLTESRISGPGGRSVSYCG